MIIEILLAFAAGILVGMITGLLPGIHINLVASFILSLSLSTIFGLPLAVFICSLSVTHVIIDFIPTTLLGVPNEENFLAIFPAHKLVRAGKAYEAMKYAFLGVLCALPAFLLIIPIYLYALDGVYSFLEKSILYVLIASSAYLLLREKEFFPALCVFALSGILGFFAFNLPVKEPLLPLLSGLFGISSLLSGMHEEESFVKQKTNDVRIKSKNIVKPAVIASIVSPFFSFMPAIGAGHISLFCSEISKHNARQFIFLNGFTSALTMNLSIVAAYTIGKTRTGTAAAVKELLAPFSSVHLGILVLAIILSTIVVISISRTMAIKSIQYYSRAPYVKIATFTLLFVVLLNIIVTNSLGLIVLACGSSLGLLSIILRIRRIQLMGSLLIPTIIYYLL